MADLFKSKSSEYKVEANRVTPEHVDAIALWCGGVAVQEHDALQHEVTYAGINVPTPVGMVRAQEGDWVLKQPGGEFSTMPDGLFRHLYEAVVNG